jgi:hypothetical protein
MQVRLIHKFSVMLNGFDLSNVVVGDVLLVTDTVAAMLIREGWAEQLPVVATHQSPYVEGKGRSQPSEPGGLDGPRRSGNHRAHR